jgi:uncharacterized membrane protein YuzA (DUF378 family)
MVILAPARRGAEGGLRVFNRMILGFTVFTAGALCLAWGVITAMTFEAVSELSGGSPRGEAIWYIILGLIGVIAGGFGFLSGWRRRTSDSGQRD